MKLLDSSKRIYTKYNVNKNTSCGFYPSPLLVCLISIPTTNSLVFLTWFPASPQLFPKSPPWFPAFPTFPNWFPLFPSLFTAFSTWLSASLPNSPHSPHSVPQFPNPSLKTLATSWRSSHQSVSQRKQFFRIAFLQSIKLKGFLIFAKMSKKIFYISNLASLQPVILLEIELSHWCFSIILKVHCWIVLLHLF